MPSSASGQDESNSALWLATRAGKMELSCPLGTTRRVPQEKFLRKPYSKSFIDQVCSITMAGYWPHSFFASLSTSTPSRSINTLKQNLANIQPSLTLHLLFIWYLQLNFKDRVINYKAEGRIHKLQWVYDGTAWDVESGTSVEARHHKSTQGAIEHAVKELINNLKAQGLLS